MNLQKIPFANFLPWAAIFMLMGCSPGAEMEKMSLNKHKSLVFGKSAAPIAVQWELLPTSEGKTEMPYFEMIINGELLTANDPVWAYQGKETRSMGNGGTEYRLRFEAVEGNAKGLQLLLFQQVFPESALVREKLELHAAEGASFTLNKREGKLHFKFPQYQLATANAAQWQEIRMASWERKPITFAKADDPEGKSNHMYYPHLQAFPLAEGDGQIVKGPIALLQTEGFTFGLAYEHASQDDLSGLLDEGKVAEDGRIVDAMQGTKGVFDFPIRAEDFHFLGMRAQRTTGMTALSVEALRGAYLDGETIDAAHPYASVWVAHFSHQGQEMDSSRAIIRDYLLHKICEKPASRKPEFYYNTWGMQRASEQLRDVLSYENIFKEIEYAAQLGVDIFVLDDGWQEKFGQWEANSKRLPQGLAPIKQKLDEKGLKMGIWLSPATVDSTSERYRAHPEWVVKDSEGNPIRAQWGHAAFDMVSGFQQLFIEDCKRLIDQGARFFKWDAINTFYSSLPNLHHGSDAYSEAELRARYEYLLPLYVVEAMEILTDYEPELIIEVDLTEARRVMTGLAPLSQGKLFWMNNGASGYNDYSPYRTQSMRTIPNEFAGLIPLELFTYANYPHDLERSQLYNVHTSLIAGHGFWGRLGLMTDAERQRVGERVALSKQVLPYLVDNDPQVVGKVGNSPEIYTQVNTEAAAGQVLAFSTAAIGMVPHVVPLTEAKPLAVLQSPYQIAGDRLQLSFDLDREYATQAAFLLPQNASGIYISESEVAIETATFEGGALQYQPLGAGVQKLFWAGNSVPSVAAEKPVQTEATPTEGGFILTIENPEAENVITVK